jgi:dihydrolipoamide dehydrogenase
MTVARAIPPEACDLLVVGGGQAGCAAALRGAELGMSVLLVEERAAGLGGAYLHETRIPMAIMGHARATLRSLDETGYGGHAAGYGGIRLEEVARHARKVTSTLGESAREVLASAGVSIVRGRGFFAGEQLVAVLDTATGDEAGVVKASSVLIATGTVPVAPAWFAQDSVQCLWPHELLAVSRMPGRCVVVGADAAACDTALFAAGFGAQVTLLAGAEQLLPGVDADVRDFVSEQLVLDGVRVETGDAGCVVEAVPDGQRNEVRMLLNGGSVLCADTVVVCPGRRPRLASLGLRKLGIGVSDAGGGVVVNRYLRTAAASIYAAGECVTPGMPAETARQQGIFAAERAAGGAETRPAPVAPGHASVAGPGIVASAGLAEDQARRHAGEVAVGVSRLSESAGAMVVGAGSGFVKVVADAATGEILGVHAAGHMASELVAAASLAMQFEYTVRDLAGMEAPSPGMLTPVVAAAREAAAGLRR